MNGQQAIIGRNDFYKRNGVSKLDALNLCRVLGLNPNRFIVQAADLLVWMNSNY